MLLTVTIQQNVDYTPNAYNFVVFLPKQLWWRTKACNDEQILVASSATINQVTTDTRLEAKAKGQKKNPRPRSRTALTRTDPLEAKDKNARGQAKDTGASVLQNKKVFKTIFQAISKIKGLQKNFTGDLQNFNNSKNTAVLEQRTGQFSRTWGFEAKDLKMCPGGQGRPRELHLWLPQMREIWNHVVKYMVWFGSLVLS